MAVGGRLVMITIPGEHFLSGGLLEKTDDIWLYLFKLHQRQSIKFTQLRRRPFINILDYNDSGSSSLQYDLPLKGWVNITEGKGAKGIKYRERVADDLRQVVHRIESLAGLAPPNGIVRKKKTHKNNRVLRYVILCERARPYPYDFIFVRWDNPDESDAAWDLATQNQYYAEHLYRTSLAEDLEVRKKRLQGGIQSIVLTVSSASPNVISPPGDEEGDANTTHEEDIALIW